MRHLFPALAAGAVVLGLGLAGLPCGPAHAEPGAQWGYSGPGGPQHWGTLSPEFAACAAGMQQSPIDLTDPVPADLPALAPAWAPSARWTVINNGHTIQASSSNAGGITIDGTRYDLLQFHFHHPSEHAIAGEHAPMEVHFVHRSAAGKLAVIGVMLTGGGAPGALDRIIEAAPRNQGAHPLGALDPASLLPAEGGYWRYQGSLTTPPCSEIVSWTVMKRPVAVSDAAISAFQSMIGPDARPLQQMHRRYLLSN